MYFQNPLADAILRSFELWLSQQKSLASIVKTMTDGTKLIINTSFQEMIDYRPSTWEHWWLKHHMRFKGIKQTDFTTARILVYPFLTAYTRGELSYEPKRTRNKKNTKTEN